MSIQETLSLAQELLKEPSITPDDCHCQEILAARLQKMNFNVENMDSTNVKNLYARRGSHEPVLLFAGHTDVVPPGPLEQWTSPPFQPTIRDGRLYGRGAADMKSSLAAMVCACEQFILDYPDHKGSIAFLITSDEEGKAIHGTRHVIDKLLERNEKITWCIVGEASSEEMFGDVIKVGRRGSLNGKLILSGRQGHVAYPQRADNPIHKSIPLLYALLHEVWDEGNTYFPPTSFQISKIYSGTNPNNVIPSQLEIAFNFRFGTATTAKLLQQRVHAMLPQGKLSHIDWHLSGEPFLSKLGSLFSTSSTVIKKVTGVNTRLSTGGGTSDARFIIKMGCEILEIGPVNHSIHQIDECIHLEELKLLTQVYYEILVSLLR
jgi:succinyl-diaminopimelate desuccinylase